MKKLGKEDLFTNFSQFMDSRGVKLKKGAYTKAVKQGCSLLTDAINLGQQGVEVAVKEVDKTLGQMRHVIHEATAPRKPGAANPDASISGKAASRAKPAAAAAKAPAGKAKAAVKPAASSRSGAKRKT